MNTATTKDYCDPGVTSLMTLREWCEATATEPKPGPNGTVDIECLSPLPRRWYDQLWNLSDYAVMGGTRTLRLTPQDNTRRHGPGYGQA